MIDSNSLGIIGQSNDRHQQTRINRTNQMIDSNRPGIIEPIK